MTQATTQVPQPAPTQPPAKSAKEKNVLGLVALIVAAVGFILACVPGILIAGWILLPTAFVLAIVSLCLPGKSKSLGLIGLILSIVGTIVGVIVFLSVVASSIDDAFAGGETTAIAPEATNEEVAGGEETAEEQGTRANPYPIGTAITQGDWTVTINSVNLDAIAELTADSMFNDAPDAGMTYMLVNLTATYNGSDPDGGSAWATVNYVTVEGNTIDGLEKFLIAPDSFDSLTTLYEGASVTGNQALQIPAETAGEGVLVVHPTMFGDKVFVAVN